MSAPSAIKGLRSYLNNSSYPEFSISRSAAQEIVDGYSDLQLERDELAAEIAALKGGPQGFFAYGSESGYEEFDTAEEAQEAAEEELAYYRGEACDGWSDEVGSVVWGVIMQRATMTGLRPVTEDDSVSPEIKEICDYALLPKVESPATDAAIAEWKAQGVEECARDLAGHVNLRNPAAALRVFASIMRRQAARLRAGVEG